MESGRQTFRSCRCGNPTAGGAPEMTGLRVRILSLLPSEFDIRGPFYNHSPTAGGASEMTGLRVSILYIHGPSYLFIDGPFHRQGSTFADPFTITAPTLGGAPEIMGALRLGSRVPGYGCRVYVEIFRLCIPQSCAHTSTFTAPTAGGAPEMTGLRVSILYIHGPFYLQGSTFVDPFTQAPLRVVSLKSRCLASGFQMAGFTDPSQR